MLVAKLARSIEVLSNHPKEPVVKTLSFISVHSSIGGHRLKRSFVFYCVCCLLQCSVTYHS